MNATINHNIELDIRTWVCGLIWSTRSSDINILGKGPLTPAPPWEIVLLGGENHNALNFLAGNRNSSRGVYPKSKKNLAMESIP